jgi:G3E family GTPase
LVALSKVDLTDATGREQIRVAVAAVRPAAIVIDAPHGEVPLGLLFPYDPSRTPTPRLPTPRLPTPREIAKRRPMSDRFESLSWTSEQPVSLPRLQSAIARLAPKLARAKGFFETVEQPGRQFLFQLAGGRATLTPAATTGVHKARIVFIAEIGVLSSAEIARVMDVCTATSP